MQPICFNLKNIVGITLTSLIMSEMTNHFLLKKIVVLLSKWWISYILHANIYVMKYCQGWLKLDEKPLKT